MAAAAEELPFARQERLRFVEAVLLWEGSIQRSRVCQAFGVSANHVTRDLSLYEAQHPGSLEYKPRERAYVPGPKFRPIYASPDPAPLLARLQARADSPAGTLFPEVATAVPVSTLPSPSLGVDKNVLQVMLRSIHRGHGVGATYHSLSDAEPTTVRVWPHAVFNTGLRWYVRAFDEVGGRFRDYALPRFERAHALSTAVARPPAEDTAWTRCIRLDVIPHPKLNAHQQRVVAREFSMKRDRAGWVWTLQLRECLVGYFARRYRLDDKPPVSPQSHWLVLKDRAALKPYFLPESAD